MADYRPVEGSVEHGSQRRRQLGCIAAGLGLLVVLLMVTVYLCVFRSVPLRISKETTYITEPLTPDGKRVDYFAAWEQQTYPQDIATDENGYRLMVQHLGKPPEATSAHFAQVCEKLGLSADTLDPDMTLQEPHDFLKAYVESENFDEALIERLAEEDDSEGGDLTNEYVSVLTNRVSAPWTLDDLPMMRQWLAENGPTMDLVAVAARKPTFHIPMVQENEDASLMMLLLPEIQNSRSFARALNARAHYRIGTGDIDGAIDDIVACKRFGRHIGPGGCFVQMLVGIAIEGISDAIGVAGSLEHPPTKQQLVRLVQELNDLPPKSSYSDVVPFERYCTLDTVQSMAHGKGGLDELGVPGVITGGIGIDWNVVSRRVNEQFDAMATTGACPRPAWSFAAILSVRARSRLLADTFGSLLFPATDAAQEARRRSECVDRMHQITLAMLLYECDHGTLPPAHTVDADGNPLHSWRVALLPYLGQQELHDKIRLDEPWDSQHNKQFHKQAVDFYRCPSAALPPGQTTYSVVVGPDTAFEAGKGKTLSQFGPKSARMILVVERKASACWMNPTQDVAQADAEEGINVPDGGGMAIGSPHPGGANFGLRDGGNQFLPDQIAPELFKGLLQGTVDRVP